MVSSIAKVRNTQTQRPNMLLLLLGKDGDATYADDTDCEQPEESDESDRVGVHYGTNPLAHP